MEGLDVSATDRAVIHSLFAKRARTVIAVVLIASAGIGWIVYTHLPTSRSTVCKRLATMNAKLASAPRIGFDNAIFDAAKNLGSAAQRLHDSSVPPGTVSAVHAAGKELSRLGGQQSIYQGALNSAAAPITSYCAQTLGLASGSHASGTVAGSNLGGGEPAQSLNEEGPAEAAGQAAGSTWSAACARAVDQVGSDIVTGSDPNVDGADAAHEKCELTLAGGGSGMVTLDVTNGPSELQGVLAGLGLEHSDEQPLDANWSALAPAHHIRGVRQTTFGGDDVVAMSRSVGDGRTQTVSVMLPADTAKDRLQVAALYVYISMDGG
jgi:hypothetical protein